MKFRIQLKDPDGFYDGFDDASAASVTDLDGLDEDEKSAVREKRSASLRRFGERWVEYGEYITIEFDTEANTATVVELSK